MRVPGVKRVCPGVEILGGFVAIEVFLLFLLKTERMVCPIPFISNLGN